MKASRILAAACLLLAWQAGPAHADSEAVPSPQEAAVLGNDISWPQCGVALPPPPAFAIVGLNGGRPHTANSCFVEQLAWADRSADAVGGTLSGIYVNTAAAGPAGSLWWPANNSFGGGEVSNPYGLCDGSASPACAYVHGFAMAHNDAASLRESGGGDAARRVWWLDVETGNSWLANKAANAAELEGMTAYLQGTGVEVGIYSTGYQFGEIVGEVGTHSNLYTLKSWLAGAESTSSAADLCGAAPLTSGGVVALTQFTAGNLDYNFRCPVAQPAPPPALVPPAAPQPPPAPAKTRSNRYAEIPAAQIA